MKKLGRPKIENKKVQLNLSLDEEAIKKGRIIAKKLNKSLSEFTQDVYLEDYYETERPLQDRIKDIEEEIKLIKLKWN